MEQIKIVKIGGNIINDADLLTSFLKDFAQISGKKILVHGGGKLATTLAEQLNIPQQMVEGRRVTDLATLKIVTMVYAGFINKQIVAQLQAFDCNAMGLSGVDGAIINAEKRKSTLDYGFVGDITNVDVVKLTALLEIFDTIVIAPITHNHEGQLLNTNADTIAQRIANAFADTYIASLVYMFEKQGVLLDIEDDTSLIAVLDKANYQSLKQSGQIANGMIPKLDNAFEALDSGVYNVVIGSSEALLELLNGGVGTKIVL